MQLIPKHPPGRSNRKARAFAADIARLRTEGYTLEAIRSALADTGVLVSLSTVQREAARCVRRIHGAATPQNLHAPAHRAPPPSQPIHGHRVIGADPRTGKEIAAEFIAKHITNPLIRDRSNQS